MSAMTPREIELKDAVEKHTEQLRVVVSEQGTDIHLLKMEVLSLRNLLGLILNENERLNKEIAEGLSESTIRGFIAKRETDVANKCLELAIDNQCEFHCNGDGHVADSIKKEYNL